METTKKIIGTRIKSIRARKKLTQENLSEKSGINPVYLSNIERGKANPTLDVLIRIANALEVDMWELFDFGQEGTPSELTRLKNLLDNFLEGEELKHALSNAMRKWLKEHT